MARSEPGAPLADALTAVALSTLTTWFPSYPDDGGVGVLDGCRVRFIVSGDATFLKVEQNIWPYERRAFLVSITIEETPHDHDPR